MIEREFQIRVRYKETDAMGVVHNSNYVNYYEVARTELLRELGTSYLELEKSGVMLPIRKIEMDLFSPAFYDDMLTIKVVLRKMPTAKMVFEHEIYNPTGDLINKGTVVVAFMDSKTRRVCRAPEWFSDKLAVAFK